MLGFKARDAEWQRQRRDFGFDNWAEFALILALDFHIPRLFVTTTDYLQHDAPPSHSRVEQLCERLVCVDPVATLARRLTTASVNAVSLRG